MTLPEKRCDDCGSKLDPIPARFDGEPTFVSFYPCKCADARAEDKEREDEKLERAGINLEKLLSFGIQYTNKRGTKLLLRKWPKADHISISRLTKGGNWTEIATPTAEEIRAVVNLYIDAVARKAQEAKDQAYQGSSNA